MCSSWSQVYVNVAQAEGFSDAHFYEMDVTEGVRVTKPLGSSSLYSGTLVSQNGNAYGQGWATARSSSSGNIRW
jgi:hypothetical protein